MANIRSQIKRNRQSVGRRERNRHVLTEIKTRTKTALATAESGDAEAAVAALRHAQKRIDTAVTKGVLHAKTAARRKSRLMRQVSRLLGQAPIT